MKKFEIDDLDNAIIAALKYHEGEAHYIDIAKYIWENYESDLRNSGSLFYTWQYRMMNESANYLRETGKITRHTGTKGYWKLLKG